MTDPKLRIAYLSGPTNAFEILAALRSGAEPNYFGTNYMREFLIFADEFEAKALIATWHNAPKSVRRRERCTFLNLPPPRAAGLGYHLQLFRQQLIFLWHFLKFRPDVLLLTGNQEFWWVMWPLKLRGTRFVASFHGVIWPKFRKPKIHQRLLLQLNKWLALRNLDAAVLTSEDIRLQLQEATGQSYPRIRVLPHLPSYDDRQFDGIVPAETLARSPFRVMFMGRIEENKGVFDLVEMAARLEQHSPGAYRFEVCGSGSASERLETEIEARGLERVVTCNGYCDPPRIREIMGRSHAVVVPTRKDFDAGFEMTCSEAILSGRPLITSAVCPALHYLKGASIEVEPENVSQYCDAIRRLREDDALYRSKCRQCGPLRLQFLDSSKSWLTAMRHAFEEIRPAQPRRP